MPKVLHGVLQKGALVSPHAHPVLFQPLQYRCQVVKMFCFRTPGDENVIQIADHPSYSLQDRVHALLEERGAEATPKGRRLYLKSPWWVLMVTNSADLS